MHAIARTYGPDLNGIGVCDLTGPKNAADARLIAAAPELLEALQGMLNIVSDSYGVDGYHLNGEIAEWDEFSDEINAANAAIAKATGAQP
jgi:hypothetical protein